MTLPDQLQIALDATYHLERELGAGGMATVYLAHDTRHDRRVAVKVLRPELAAVIGAERFLAEIKLTAQLQHPHILPLFDSGAAGSFLYYVMPYIEGESLRDRLRREHQLPIDDALRIATEVASALDYAHRRGVIHRDVKPENILLHEGTALVADFGIALAASKAGGARMTETGMSLGTPHYMSPEQAMGEREITARSDVYALGAVTYEMLTGDPPFTGSTAQAVVARVVTEQPRPLVPQRHTILPHVEAAVLTALEKLPADRFATAAEFADALARPDMATVPRMNTAPSRTLRNVPPGRRTLAGAVPWAVAALTLAAALWGWRTSARHPAGGVIRLAIAWPDAEKWTPSFLPDIALAPDGRSFVYTSGKGAAARLALRRLDQLHATPLAGTEGATFPAFSPDGRSLAFATSARGEVRIVTLAGDPPATLLPAGAAGGGLAWGADGYVYSANDRYLERIPATGGQPEVLIRPDTAHREQLAYLPEPLPNGRGVLYVVDSDSGREIRALRLATHEVVRFGPGALARFVPGGYLAVVQEDGKMTVAPFDQDKLAVTGPAVPILDQVNVLSFKNGANVALSANGTLLYGEAGAAAEVTPVWVDRAGAAREVETGWKGSYDQPALSPDGTRIALSRTSPEGHDIWIKQLGGALSRLTLDGAGNVRPTWSTDGRAVLYALDGGGLMQQPADGSAPARSVMNSSHRVLEALYSRDGAWLIYRVGGGSGESRDIYARRLKGADSAPVPVVATPADEYSPALSPDGKWLAYVSDESGRPEVYVRPFPDASRAKWQISSDGGSEPLWAHRGRQLFYRNGAGALVAVTLDVDSAIAERGRQVLFDASAYRREPEPVHADYAVSPDDQHFLMLREAALQSPPLILVLNWVDEVRERVKGGR